MHVVLGKHVVSLWLIGLIVGVFCAGAFAAYLALTITIPFTVTEPIEIVDYPSALSLYPGEVVLVNVTIINHASLSYAVFLDLKLDNSTYDEAYVTVSNQNYSVSPGMQTLTPSLSVSSGAPPLSTSLRLSVQREALSTPFMGNGEQLQLGSPYAWTNGGATVSINVACLGGSKVTIASVRINGTAYTTISGNPGLSISPTSSTILTVSSVSPTFISGYYYQIIVVTAKNNEFQTTGLVP